MRKPNSVRFGHFDDARREYVISTPHTPLPWINYLGTESFISLVSHQAGGYCFYRDARLRRILRFRYNNVPADAGGRCYYIRDGEDVWSPSYMPMKRELENYECRHGLGYTRIHGRRNGVSAQLLFLVPRGANAELHQLTLRNETDRTKRLRVFSFVEFCLWNALDDQTNFQRNLSTGEVEIEGSTLFHTTEYRERRDHFAFFHCACPIDGFDTDREAFLGPYNSFGDPQVVLRGRSGQSVASGWSPIGSHQVNVELAPGEERRLVFLLGYVENPRDDKWERPGVVQKRRARELIERYSTPAQVDAAVESLRDYWSSLLGRFQVDSPDERLNRMVNIWNPYQCMVTFSLSRSASYFESGIGRGMGFRDSNQDLLGFVHLVPERARERLLDLAATQRTDGSAYHQYQPLTKRGNDEIGSGFNDDPLWLILAVAAYVKETGDLSILEERVPFDNDETTAAPLLEHLKRSFDHPLGNRGPHGLPLIGRADWNDCLNLNCFSETPDESYQTTTNRDGKVAESVFIAALFVRVGADYAELCARAGRSEEASRARAEIERMRVAVLEHGWDGDWFLRAYDFNGNKVGSHTCKEGQIFIEPQGFCVMAGIGLHDGRAEQALDAVKERLDTEYGIVLLNPAYTRYHLELGEITSYPPGYKENAGIFCHNNPWVIIAETMLGRAQRAFDYYRKITPAYLEEVSEIHKTEPYVYSQMIAGKDAARHGEAKNSWLTGTAAWTLTAVCQHLLGVRPDYEGLRIEPCLDASLSSLTVERQCRGATYRITIRNGSTGKPPRLTVNGAPLEGTVVPYAAPGNVVKVDCNV